MAMVSAEGHYPVSRIPTRNQQLGSRQGISLGADFSRVEAGRKSVQECVPEAWTMPGRLVCFTSQQPAGEVRQLETGPICNGNRCTADQLVGTESLRLSPICSDRAVPPKDQGRRMHSTSNSTMLENPPVLPCPARIASGLPNSPAQPQESTEGPSQPTTSSEIASSCRLESIRKQHASVGVSEQAAELLSAGWSKGTNTAYQSGWRRWYSWCYSRNIDPIHGGIQPFLDFLSEVFKEGLEYRSINVIRSAVSTTHAPLEGSPIGQHPLVSQLMKGIYNSRPPKPHYTCTWDVDIVVRYLKGLGSNADLSLKTLSGKLILLMSLTLASRTSELHALDLRFRFFRPEGVLRI